MTEFAPRIKRDVQIYRGDDLTLDIVVLDSTGAAVNLTGFTITAQVRPSFDSTHVLGSFVATITSAVSGKFTINLPASVTKTILLPDGQAVWDVQIASGAATPLVHTPEYGNVSEALDVTH